MRKYHTFDEVLDYYASLIGIKRDTLDADVLKRRKMLYEVNSEDQEVSQQVYLFKQTQDFLPAGTPVGYMLQGKLYLYDHIEVLCEISSYNYLYREKVA